MTREDLASWQARCTFETQEQAAEALWVPLQTYRNWLAGRRGIPDHIELLCRYVEAHGPIARPLEAKRS